MGGGFERTSHVASKRSKRGGADEALKGWAAVRVGVDASDIGWKEGMAQTKEGSGGFGPRGEGSTEKRWGFDISVDGIEREGAGGMMAVERETDGACGGSEEKGSGGGNRVTKAKAAKAIRKLGDVGCCRREGQGGGGDVGEEHGDGGVDGIGEGGTMVEDRRGEVRGMRHGGGKGGATVGVGRGRSGGSGGMGRGGGV